MPENIKKAGHAKTGFFMFSLFYPTLNPAAAEFGVNLILQIKNF